MKKAVVDAGPICCITAIGRSTFRVVKIWIFESRPILRCGNINPTCQRLQTFLPSGGQRIGTHMGFAACAIVAVQWYQSTGNSTGATQKFV